MVGDYLRLLFLCVCQPIQFAITALLITMRQKLLFRSSEIEGTSCD